MEQLDGLQEVDAAGHQAGAVEGDIEHVSGAVQGGSAGVAPTAGGNVAESTGVGPGRDHTATHGLSPARQVRP